MMFLALLLAASAPADADVEAVNRAAAALQPHVNTSGTWLDGRPGSDRLLDAQWRAVQRWAAHWLDRHPHSHPEALARAGAVFGEYWGISATALGHGDVLVSVSRYQFGNAFILGSGGSGYRLRWATDMHQARLNAAADRALSYWRPGQCDGGCAVAGVNRNGRLPDAANGAARFWIDAAYAREAGSTGPRQLSLWSWQNGRATPLLVHDYSAMIEQPGPSLRGSVLHVPSKRYWNSLYSCGSCFGRVTDLPFAIGPGSVRALPPAGRTPEIDLVDRVFARVLAGRSVGALASPSAARVIRKQLAARLAETDRMPKDSAGMVMGWKRWRSHGLPGACLDVDGVGATAFAFDSKITRITAATPLKPEGCDGDGARM